MVANRDALPELAQFGVVEAVPELWLTHEDNLKEFAVVRLQIR